MTPPGIRADPGRSALLDRVAGTALVEDLGALGRIAGGQPVIQRLGAGRAVAGEQDESGEYETTNYHQALTLFFLARQRAGRGISSLRGCPLLLPCRLAQANRTLQKQLALARVAGQRRRALELGARLVEPAELVEEVAAHARQQVVAFERRLGARASTMGEARRRARRPTRSPRRGSARRPATASPAPAPRRARRCGPSRSRSAVRARAWQAAIAACSA